MEHFWPWFLMWLYLYAYLNWITFVGESCRNFFGFVLFVFNLSLTIRSIFGYGTSFYDSSRISMMMLGRVLNFTFFCTPISFLLTPHHTGVWIYMINSKLSIYNCALKKCNNGPAPGAMFIDQFLVIPQITFLQLYTFQQLAEVIGFIILQNFFIMKLTIFFYCFLALL